MHSTPMDNTPDFSAWTFTDSQSAFTLDDLIDPNVLPVLDSQVPELFFTPTSPNSSGCGVDTFLGWSSEEVNTSSFLKPAPGLLFGSLSQTVGSVEPVADAQDTSAVLQISNQNLHYQRVINNIENEDYRPSQLHLDPGPQDSTISKTQHAYPVEPGFTLSGWSPANGLYEIVDIPHLHGTIPSDRQPLMDVTSAYSSKNRNFTSTTRLSNQANSITSTALYNTLYNNNPNELRQLPSEYPKSFGLETKTNTLVLSDPSFDSPPIIPLMRCTPSGRPIGGVPPEFARAVANKVIKKERAKEDARRAKGGFGDDRCALPELPTKRTRDRKLDDEGDTSDKKSRRGVNVARRDEISMASAEADFKEAMVRFLDIDGVQVKESPSSLVNALGRVLEDPGRVVQERTAKRVVKKGEGKQGGRSGKRFRL